MELSDVELVCKTTQFPTWRERIFNQDALFYWVCALEQEREALRLLELHRQDGAGLEMRNHETEI